jgi:hypothetical protein
LCSFVPIANVNFLRVALYALPGGFFRAYFAVFAQLRCAEAAQLALVFVPRSKMLFLLCVFTIVAQPRARSAAAK